MKKPLTCGRIMMMVLLILLAAALPVFAGSEADPGRNIYRQVRKTDLGISSLTLDVGETYTFNVTFEPEDPVITVLTWFNTDETVVRLNGKTNTVTALKPGTARLMAESFDHVSSAVCEITVTGKQEKYSSAVIGGASKISLSDADRAKIKSSRVERHLELLEASDFSEAAIRKLNGRSMDVTAKVNPGTEEAESERALALGMSEAYPMKKVHAVSLHGTFGQILEFIGDNDDLIRIFEVPDIYDFDLPSRSIMSLSQHKAVLGELMLEDHVEELSSVSVIRDMGFTGLGATIAVIDSGVDRNHEQFDGRVIAESCFNRGYILTETESCEACDPDDPECTYTCTKCESGACEETESCKTCDPSDADCGYECYIRVDHFVCENSGDSSLPSGALKLDSYNHGSHVTGIAAGEDGIAPDAYIVEVNIRSEYIRPDLKTEDNPSGYFSSMDGNDLLAALNWLLELQERLAEEGNPISIVNMSLGDGEFETFCDDESEGYASLFEVFQQINEAGMIPVAAAGSDFLDGKIANPACYSNVVAVGALAGMDEPMIANYSNHNETVDILAPGTDLYSSLLVNTNDGADPECTENCYGFDYGTSMAAPMVSGSLALLMQAFPDRPIDEYKSMLIEMAMKTVDRRNSNDKDNRTSDDLTGTRFDYKKPILDFSNFSEYFLSHISAGDTPEEQPDNPASICFPCIPLPRTGFSMHHPQELRVQPLSVQYKPTRLTLQLPTLSVESEILTVPEVNGEYPVEWLGSSVGMLEGSGQPGKGIMFLTGHNHLNTTEAGPFLALGTLNIGDRVVLSDSMNKTFVYKVSGNYKIAADGFASIAGNLSEKTLVLITCEDESAEGGYLHRRVIFAEPL